MSIVFFCLAIQALIRLGIGFGIKHERFIKNLYSDLRCESYTRRYLYCEEK